MIESNVKLKLKNKILAFEGYRGDCQNRKFIVGLNKLRSADALFTDPGFYFMILHSA